VCHAIRALEGKPQRCASQTYKGELTHIEWTADRIVLPTIPDSVASAGVISAHGITAASRGLKFKRPDGTQQRPDLAIIDDPQTDESATSPIQISKRLGIIRKNICKLGGHARKIAVVINATVIAANDLIDQMLDQKRHPEWQSERVKMVRRWSDAHETLWLEDYTNLRNTYDPAQPGAQKIAHAAATKFYKKHRAAMDAGCEVSWVHCFDPETEISAIQHAYNSLIDDGPEVFASEAQNEPLIPREEKDLITPAEIASKLNKIPRGTLPAGTQWLTAMIDVQGSLLYYLVLASGPGFTCSSVDYGTYPQQRGDYFTIDTARVTFATQFPGASQEAQILAALDGLTEQLLSKVWLTETGKEFRIALCGVDGNWVRDLVYAFCRRSRFAPQLIPHHGRGIGPDGKPISDWAKKDSSDRKGLNWFLSAGKVGVLRHVVTDINWWKTFLYARLRIAVGDKGGLTLFGRAPHRMLADHFASEYPTKTAGRGRQVDVWKMRPGKTENHLLDCIIGALVMASILGCSLIEFATPARRRKKYASVNYLE
jgi:phage terminase large subunit GpA-like protein